MFSQLASKIPYVQVDGKNYYELSSIETILSEILGVEYNLSDAAASVPAITVSDDYTGTTKNYYTEEKLYMILLSDHGLFSILFRNWLSSCVLPLINNEGVYMTLGFGGELIHLLSNANKNMEIANKNLAQLSQDWTQEPNQAQTINQ